MQVKTIAATISGAALVAMVGTGIALVVVFATPSFSTQVATDVYADAVQPQSQTADRADEVVAPAEITQPGGPGAPQTASDGPTAVKPYIGVAIILTDSGEVQVVKVLTDGSSVGILEPGDLITAVDGNLVEGFSDVTDPIADAGSGGTIALSITRNGQAQDVTVTVGQREVHLESGRPKFGGTLDFPNILFMNPLYTADRFASGQMVLADEDGNYRTYRTVVSAVSHIDADAGTFVLNPRDGSDPISYTISDETRLNVRRPADLAALNTEDDTLVYDIDGEVQIVQQGEAIFPPGAGMSPGFGRLRRHMGAFGPFTDHPEFDPSAMLERVRDHLSTLDDPDMSNLIPDDFREHIDRLRSGRPGSGTYHFEYRTPSGSWELTIPNAPEDDDDALF